MDGFTACPASGEGDAHATHLAFQAKHCGERNLAVLKQMTPLR